METNTNPDDLARALERSGCSWVLGRSDRDATLRRVAAEIDKFLGAFSTRYSGEDPPDPFALLDANPSKGAAFFQTFTRTPISVAMRVLVWKLILGDEIDALHVEYRRGRPAVIRVALAGNPVAFDSDNLWDFQVLRNLGLLAIDGMPVLDGYHAIAD